MEDLKKSVSEALENIQQRPWAEPLGKTLQFSGKIVKELRDFVPGAMIVGGALCFGAALLHPSPSMGDLQKQLGETQEKLDAKGNSEAIMRKLIQEKKDIRHKMENRDSIRPLSVCFLFRTSGKQTDTATPLSMEKFGRIDFSLARWVTESKKRPNRRGNMSVEPWNLSEFVNPKIIHEGYEHYSSMIIAC